LSDWILIIEVSAIHFIQIQLICVRELMTVTCRLSIVTWF